MLRLGNGKMNGRVCRKRLNEIDIFRNPRDVFVLLLDFDGWLRKLVFL